MPHKCMDCKNMIESGTIDLQKGCPICGGKKFQYIRPRPRDEEKATVSEYVVSAALREPQLEAKESPVSRFPERKPRENVKERPVQEMPPEKLPERKPPKKPAADMGGDRIESIRIVEQGTYDINLPLLLSRKELVMSKEDGNYVVDLNSVLKKPGKKKHKGH